MILVGQPALSQQLDAPEFTQLAQRARLRFHLTALSPEQTHGYIVHRLAIAGSHGREIFQPECFALIDCYSGGAPRLINALCDAALRSAAGAGRDQVLAEDVETAALRLQLPALSERPAEPEAAPVRPEPRPKHPPKPRATAPPRPWPRTARARASAACGS